MRKPVFIDVQQGRNQKLTLASETSLNLRISVTTKSVGGVLKKYYLGCKQQRC